MRWEAKGALEGVQSRKAYGLLLAVIRSHADTERREEACCILAFSFDDILIEPFQQIFADKRLSSRVRAQAAEGLADLLGYVDRRTKLHRETAALLIEGLRDPSPDVRFRTCFALGSIRARQAVPQLERVAAEDEAICPRWWHVRDEAADAVGNIRGKGWPDRVPIPE